MMSELNRLSGPLGAGWQMGRVPPALRRGTMYRNGSSQIVLSFQPVRHSTEGNGRGVAER